MSTDYLAQCPPLRPLPYKILNPSVGHEGVRYLGAIPRGSQQRPCMIIPVGVSGPVNGLVPFVPVAPVPTAGSCLFFRWFLPCLVRSAKASQRSRRCLRCARARAWGAVDTCSSGGGRQQATQLADSGWWGGRLRRAAPADAGELAATLLKQGLRVMRGDVGFCFCDGDAALTTCLFAVLEADFLRSFNVSSAYDRWTDGQTWLSDWLTERDTQISRNPIS